ncbi:uncharacterized protein LOC131680408 [Topomyia yanbarensis]|uniref:uncharacterized protein LOC131680408 n=1 Tax=Topomyia yanbarensis TaxID=2498891 RepID=UPI00273AE6F2|nr:uncharacterized protein LOC131680408 [Topomyia yanbarensis]
MISYDFQRMYNNTTNFVIQFNEWKVKILDVYNHLFKELNDDFIRCLAIIRNKNPTRGAKRMRSGSLMHDNPLHDIIQWIGVDDTLPQGHLTPVLVVKGGKRLESSGECFISWSQFNVDVGDDLIEAFFKYCSCFDVFHVDNIASDKHFFYSSRVSFLELTS